jgi:CBS-domain-containing membrane protein
VSTPMPKVHSDHPPQAADERPRFLAEIVAAPPFEVRGDMRARVIWALFRERGMAWVPVVDETGRPIGTLLHADLASTFCPEGALSGEARDEDDPLIVADLMRREVRVLRASAPLAEARLLLATTSLPAVVVVDHRGIMLGTVSRETLAPPRPLHSEH